MYEPENVYNPVGQRLDDYRREETALRYALRELSWVARTPDFIPTPEIQAQGRERALGFLVRHLERTAR